LKNKSYPLVLFKVEDVDSGEFGLRIQLAGEYQVSNVLQLARKYLDLP
jgi:D-aminopeptidase